MIYKFTITFKTEGAGDIPVTNIMYVIDKNKKKLFEALTAHIGEEADNNDAILTYQSGVGYKKLIDDTTEAREAGSFQEFVAEEAGEHLADYVIYGEIAIYSKNVDTVKVQAQ